MSLSQFKRDNLYIPDKRRSLNITDFPLSRTSRLDDIGGRGVKSQPMLALEKEEFCAAALGVSGVNFRGQMSVIKSKV